MRFSPNMAIRPNLPSAAMPFAESLEHICQMRGISEMRNDNRYYDGKDGGRGGLEGGMREKEGKAIVWSLGLWTWQKV